MPSKITDFINTYKGLAELQQNQMQIDDARENAKVAGINTFMTLARQTADPAQLVMLVNRFAELGVGTQEQLTGILQNVTPTQEALTSHMTSRGIQVADATGKGDALASETASAQLTGQNQGQQATSQVVTNLMDRFKLPEGPMGDAYIAAAGAKAIGATPGQLVLDHALSKLGMPELTEGAGIGLGTRMSPVQAAGLDFNWAGLRENARHNRVGEALQEVGLGIEGRAAAAKADAAGAPDASNVASLISTKAGITKAIQETKETPTPATMMNWIGALNAINQQLSAAGVPNEGQLPYTPEMFSKPGFWQSFKTRNMSVTPQAPQTRQQVQQAGRPPQ